jgi:hypothetical protein
MLQKSLLTAEERRDRVLASKVYTGDEDALDWAPSGTNKDRRGYDVDTHCRCGEPSFTLAY